MDSSVISNRSFGNNQSIFRRTLPVNIPVLFGSKMLVEPKHGSIGSSMYSKSDNGSQEMLFWMDTDIHHLEDKLDYKSGLSGNSSSKPSDTHLVYKSCSLESSDFTTSSLFARVPKTLFSNLCGPSSHSGNFQGMAFSNSTSVTDSLLLKRPLSLDLVVPSNPANHRLKLSSRLVSAFEPTVPKFTSFCTSKVSLVPDALYLNSLLSSEKPLSSSSCEEWKAENYQSRVEPQDSDSHTHLDPTPSSDLTLCLEQLNATVGCESDKCEAKCDITSFLPNPKKLCGSNCRVRFLCKRKNSLIVKHRHPKKINFRKRCLLRMDTCSDASILSNNPNGFHTANLSSFFLRPSESDVSDSSSSDHEDCDDNASVLQFFDVERMFQHQYQCCAAGVERHSHSHWSSFDAFSTQTFCTKCKKGHCDGITKTIPLKESNISAAECDLSSIVYEDSDENEDQVDDIVFQSNVNISYNENGNLNSSEATFSVISSLKEINARWKTFYESPTESFPADSRITLHRKLVRFSDEMSLVAVLNEFEWADDYAAARQGSWVQDRMHFDRRIKETENLIGWVLCPSHRAKLMSYPEN